MRVYYGTRILVVLSLSGLSRLAGAPWWLAGMVGLAALAFFLWVPHSGRYRIHPEYGATAARHDERTRAIRDRAARNALVATTLALAGVVLYTWLTAASTVPLTWINLVLALAFLVYFVSDFWLRRAS